jgi:hypothetical protein
LASAERLAGKGIAEVVSVPTSSWPNPNVERLLGSIRRECLDYMITLNQAHLRGILTTTSITMGPERTSGFRKTRQITDR